LNSADKWFGEEVRKEIELIVTPIDSYANLYDDPQAQQNQYIVNYAHPSLGKIRVMGFPSQFTETPPAIRSAAPRLGEHNDEILAELGYSADDTTRLRNKGFVL